MSILQAILICLIYFFAVSSLSGGVGFFTFNRPLIAGFFTGLVLGDPVTGTKIGAAINLLYIGNISTGGTLPSDTTLAAILGVTLGILSGLDVKAALAIAIPVGLIGTLLWYGRLTLDSLFVPLAEKYVRNGQAEHLWIANVLLPQILLFVISVIPCFVVIFWGVDYIQNILSYMGNRILNILIVIGGIMPALGLGLLLRSLFKGNSKVYFFVGFLMVQYLNFDTVSLGFFALIIAIIYLQNDNQNITVFKNIGAYTDSPYKRVLKKRDLILSSFIWEIHAQACYNYERMQGIGFAHAMVPILKRFYKSDNPTLSRALIRHMSFFNVAPQFAAVIPGLVAAMEEQYYLGSSDITEDAINAIKTSLMGPISGIGDAIIQGMYIPLLLSFFISMSINGNVLGPILYFVIVTVSLLILNYCSYMFGYYKGGNAILSFLESGIIDKITDSARIMGCIVIGGLVANHVHLVCDIQLNLAATCFDIQTQLFDVILPGLLPLLLTLSCYRLLSKGYSSSKILLILVLLGGIGSILGILV